MATSKKTNSRKLSPAWLPGLLGFLFGRGRTATVIVLLVASLAIGCFFVWQNINDRVRASGRYTVTLERVHITPLPAWIHGDVRADVFRNASLDPPLSVLDADLAARIQSAFALHPWVLSAKVSLAPKSSKDLVDVELIYRQPVCMIEIPSDLLPVDAEGVLLPSGDFSPIEKLSYPCLAGIDTRPMGPAGQRWGDPRVVDGAAIAAALGPIWQQLKLYRIQPSASPGPNAERTYELFSRAGTRVYWGLPPTSQTTGELSTDEKVARLRQYLHDHGGVDLPQGQQVIDIRTLPPPR